MKRHCLTCRALIDSGSYCPRCRPRNGSTRAWRAVREYVLRRDLGRCVICGAPATEVDHIIPRSYGGSDDPANLRSLCADHHAERHDNFGYHRIPGNSTEFGRTRRVFVAVLIRTLREGKTYEDFVEAWYPEKGFGVGGRGPIVAHNVQNEREILTVALVDIPDRASLESGLQRVTEQEAVRHDRLRDIIESTTARGIYEVRDEFDFSTDETVAAGRPEGISR